jgi:hypothetical protein
LTRVADGFALALGPVDGRYEDSGVRTWLSTDGREWRRSDAAPGLTGERQLGFHRTAALVVDDRSDPESDTPSTHLGFLQADGTWCSVSPVGGDFYMGTMAWNEKGDALIAGSRVRHGAPVIWQATGVRCDPPIAGVPTAPPDPAPQDTQLGPCTFHVMGLQPVEGDPESFEPHDELAPPYKLRAGPDGVARVRVEGSGWGTDGPGRPEVTMTTPEGDVVWVGVMLADGDITVDYVFDHPGSWRIRFDAPGVGCLRDVAIEVEGR